MQRKVLRKILLKAREEAREEAEGGGEEEGRRRRGGGEEDPNESPIEPREKIQLKISEKPYRIGTRQYLLWFQISKIILNYDSELTKNFEKIPKETHEEMSELFGKIFCRMQ